MKKSTITAIVLSVFSVAAMTDTSQAQGTKHKPFQQHQNQEQHQQHQNQNGQKKHQTRQFTQQQYQQQQIVVDPGFSQPTPKLGFQGQIIHGFGMKIVSVNWGSPAQQVGLESGDIIMQINGRQIRSQWDYDQALRDAAMYGNGQVNLMVKNIRYSWGWNVQEYVYSTTWLPGFGHPAGPIGPQSVSPPIAVSN